MKNAFATSFGKLAAASLLAALGAAALPLATAAEVDTITIAWLPNDSSDALAGMREEIAKAVSQATGKKVENKLTTDYTIAVTALENGDAQLGWFGAFEYLGSHARHPEIVPLVVNSGPSGTLKDAQYWSRLVVRKGDEAQYKAGAGYGIENIPAKRMSFVSTSSTSGFNLPAAAIVTQFGKLPAWKSLTPQDLAQGGSGKFFRQVLFGGSHQLSLVNVLTNRADVAAVADFMVAPNVDLVAGQANTEGAVYRVKQGADAPFGAVQGKEFVVIKALPVQNPPVEVNSKFLSPKTIEAIAQVLTSDEVANNPKIFAAEGAKGSDFHRPARFVRVTDAWYDPMRKILGAK